MTNPTPIENELDEILDLLESGSMVAQHKSESSMAVEGYLQRNHEQAKTAILAWADRYAASVAKGEQAPITGDTTDGYHTFNELYAYREAYNAALFNEWALQGKYGVHKSWKHSDGKDCFGGGWFIVMAILPTGQISNHYEAQYWNDFKIPHKPQADTYDGHTPQEALNRLAALSAAAEERGEG